MKSTILSPPLLALYRVLVQPSLVKSAVTTTTRRPIHRLTTPTSPRTLFCSHVRRPQQPHHAQHDHHQHQHHLRSFSSSPSSLATRPPEKRTQLWDEEIPAYRIRAVDPITKTIQPPTALRDVLSTLPRKTHRLICVSPPPPPGPIRDRTEEWIPTCRVVSKKEIYEQERVKRDQKVAARKNSADNAKTIELNWAIAEGDLAHRMKRVEEFLGQGRKVEVVLAKRKGGRKASVEECEGLVGRIQDVVGRVEGAKVGKSMEGKLGGVATLFLEGSKKVGGKEGEVVVTVAAEG